MADSIDSGNPKPRSGGPTRGRERSETGNDVLPQRPTGGPRTPAGKARSSLNALKHGRHATKHPALLNVDDDNAFRNLLRDHLAHYAPPC